MGWSNWKIAVQIGRSSNCVCQGRKNPTKSFHGKSNLMTITTPQDLAEYQSHLPDTLLLVWKELTRENNLLMQDNAKCHVPRYSVDWYGNQNIIIMNWPPYFQDLNPI